MDPIHPAHATSDPLFYDRPRDTDDARVYDVSASRRWDDWRRVHDERWVHWASRSSELPEQGWKIHVSATPDSASTVLNVVSEYCHDAGLPFKHLSSSSRLIAALAKDADRSSAGKFVTIYPSSDAHLEQVLVELDLQLGGLPGPYILSDLRWKAGPLHVRYGAFTLKQVELDGALVPAIRDLGSGELVPDVRGTSFTIPPWVTVPAFLDHQLHLLQSTAPRWFPTVRRALHHSNAGGVYEATTGDGGIVLKEARPYAGYTPDGRDAVARLKDEEDALRTLDQVEATPNVRASFELHGHRFLTTELAAGRTLSSAVAANNPLGTRSPGASKKETYRDWAASVAANLREAVDAIHAAGRTHGDLHPGNVLVTEDASVTLIDFEMSQSVAEEEAVLFGVPGFVAPASTNPVLRDLFAVACIELHMFVPLTPLLQLDSTKLSELVSFAATTFNLPPTWTQNITARLARGLRPSAALRGSRRAGRTTTSIVEGLFLDADATRSDRLWPGDPRQFSEPTFGLAHGASGVLLALHHAGAPVGPHIRDWVTSSLEQRALGGRLGLMDGVAGALLACRTIGWHEQADALQGELVGRLDEMVTDDLYSGGAGVALVLLAEGTRQSGVRHHALRAVRDLISRVPSVSGPPAVRTGRGGLLRGASGTALVALHAYAATRDHSLVLSAQRAIDFDAASLTYTPDGAAHVNEGWRTLPYLGSGSAGIGLVMALYAALTSDDSRYGQALDHITAAACSPFTAQAGLLQGRAGLITYLREIERLGFGSHRTASALAHHTDQIWLHSITRDGVTRFVGDGLLRASADYATGSAGVLASLLEAPTLPLMNVPGWEPATRAEEGGESHGVPAVTSDARAHRR